MVVTSGGSATVADGLETTEGTDVEAEVPFAFTVVNETLPAGRYTLRSLDDKRTLAVLGSELAVAESNTVEAPHAPRITKVVFHRYGDHYFLHQVWVRGENDGIEIPESAVERQLARRLRANSVAILATK